MKILLSRQVMLALICFLCGLGLALKISHSNLSARDPVSDTTALVSFIQAKGLSLTHSYHLTEDGTYTVHRFETLECKGAILIVPILRNAEVQGLEGRLRFVSGYMVAGETYQHFPALSLLVHRTLSLSGLTTRSHPPFLFADQTDCGLAARVL